MPQKNTVQILFTDFDGTLFSKKQHISPLDIEILERLESKGIIRVIATGRSYFSLRKVVPYDFPVDYVILSSGAGIMDWRHKRLLKTFTIPAATADIIATQLKNNDLPFFVHDPLPDNHYGYYFLNQAQNPDFNRRLHLYRDYLKPLENRPAMQEASQFILIRPKILTIQNLLASLAEELYFIWATSPLDHRTLWLEIFPADVCKASAARYLCQILKIPQEATMAIGNDFNDLDLLDWAARAFVMPDSPPFLKQQYPLIEMKGNSIFASLESLK